MFIRQTSDVVLIFSKRLYVPAIQRSVSGPSETVFFSNRSSGARRVPFKSRVLRAVVNRTVQYCHTGVFRFFRIVFPLLLLLFFFVSQKFADDGPDCIRGGRAVGGQLPATAAAAAAVQRRSEPAGTAAAAAANRRRRIDGFRAHHDRRPKTGNVVGAEPRLFGRFRVLRLQLPGQLRTAQLRAAQLQLRIAW